MGEQNEGSGNPRVKDLMAALEESVLKAKEARERHRARCTCHGLEYDPLCALHGRLS